MGILAGFLLVVFVITAILLVFLVLIQDEGGDSLGGIFAGSSNSAFGSRTGNVVTRFTATLGGIFLVVAVGLAFIYRTDTRTTLDAKKAPTATEAAAGAQYDWQAGTDSPAPAASPAAEAVLGAAGAAASPAAGN